MLEPSNMNFILLTCLKRSTHREVAGPMHPGSVNVNTGEMTNGTLLSSPIPNDEFASSVFEGDYNVINFCTSRT